MPFFDPPLADDRAAADVEQLLRIAMRDGDKFVGEELMLRGLDAMINHLRVETCYILELKDKFKDTGKDKFYLIYKSPVSVFSCFTTYLCYLLTPP